MILIPRFFFILFMLHLLGPNEKVEFQYSKKYEQSGLIRTCPMPIVTNECCCRLEHDSSREVLQEEIICYVDFVI